MNPLFLSKLYLKILSAEFYCRNEIPPKFLPKKLKIWKQEATPKRVIHIMNQFDFDLLSGRGWLER